MAEQEKGGSETVNRRPSRKSFYLIAAAVLLIISIGIIAPVVTRPRSVAYRTVCGTNMARLGKAMQLYARDNQGSRPRAEKWCDLLIDGGYAKEEDFQCDGDERGPCSYSMNPNCRSWSDDADMVLLFESKPGWNQYGGPELATCDNHNGDGYNILFNDAGVEFNRCGYIETLNWGKPSGTDREEEGIDTDAPK